MTRFVLAVALAAVAVPLAGTASARCPADAVLCQTVSQACGVVRDHDPTGRICPYF